MKTAGVELFAELDELAVMGFAEVVPKIPYFKRLERRIRALLDRERPELVILVDYPGFNMRIARAAHERGCRVLYYIAPKVWAWRTGRAKALAENTDAVAVILPFESEFLASYGANAEYVGHPLLDRPDDVTPREDFFQRWGLDSTRPLLALLPGSRSQELTHHVDAFRRIAERVMEHRPDVLPVFSRAPTVDAMPFHETGLPVVEDTRALLRWSSAALVKSGTSTLETLLEDTPFVIAYRTSRITSALARRVMHVDHIGLPNLVADARVVPEFVQDEVNADTVAPVLLALLDEGSEARARQFDGMVEIRERLGTPGASGRVASMACELIAASVEVQKGGA